MKNNSVVIILGKGISPNGLLSDTGKLLVELGLKTFYSIDAHKLILSGRWSYIYDYTPKKTEARAMYDYALTLGANSNSILLEEESLDTIGNAFFSKKLINNLQNVNEIYIVTTDYHINRSKYIFEKFFGNAFEIFLIPVSDSKLHLLPSKISIFEMESLLFSKKMLDVLTSGDDEQLENTIRTLHPLYAFTPDTVPEWVWLAFKLRGRSKEWLIKNFFKT